MISFHLLQADSTSVSLPATFAIDPQTRGSTHCSQVQEADALQNAQQIFFYTPSGTVVHVPTAGREHWAKGASEAWDGAPRGGQRSGMAALACLGKSRVTAPT